MSDAIWMLSDDYSVVAEFYDYIVPYRDRQDVAFFVEQARRSGGPVLELGCGSGRILFPTAEAGIEIVGLDGAPAMLSVCRAKLARQPASVQARIELVEGDMRRFKLGRKFALVTLPFRPFQHLLTVADQLDCLAAIRDHLAERGRLIFDVFNPSLEFLTAPCPTESISEPPFTMPDGRKGQRYPRILARDLASQVQQVEILYVLTYPDGREDRVVERFPMRYFFRFELEHLLARGGFQMETVYTDYDRSAYGSKLPGELIFIAGKA